MEFDKLVVGSPLAEIPNKVQFLKSNPYCETVIPSRSTTLKWMNIRFPITHRPEFVREEIKNIISQTKGKWSSPKKLEDDVYENAAKKKILKFTISGLLLVLSIAAFAKPKKKEDKKESLGTVIDKIIVKVDNYIVLKSDLENAYQGYLTNGGESFRSGKMQHAQQPRCTTS